MPMKHAVLLLNGAAQNVLSAVDPLVRHGGPNDPALRMISLQPRGVNNSPIYGGATAVVSATDYGFRLEAGDTSDIPPAPFVLGEYGEGPMHLSDFWVIGANGENLHILYQVY